MGCYFSLRDGKSRSLRPTARWQRQRILVGVEGCVVPSVRACDDADIDYTFAQVAMKEASVDYNCNCGGMSSAVGSFAVDEQIVSVRVDDVTLRIFDTKTQKLFSSFSACRGMAVHFRKANYKFPESLAPPHLFGWAPQTTKVETGAAGRRLLTGATTFGRDSKSAEDTRFMPALKVAAPLNACRPSSQRIDDRVSARRRSTPALHITRRVSA